MSLGVASGFVLKPKAGSISALENASLSTVAPVLLINSTITG
jgi:hypothetical protein